MHTHTHSHPHLSHTHIYTHTNAHIHHNNHPKTPRNTNTVTKTPPSLLPTQTDCLSHCQHTVHHRFIDETYEPQAVVRECVALFLTVPTPQNLLLPPSSALSGTRSAMQCYAMLCHAMLRQVMPCHAMQCYAMPCHAMPCRHYLHCNVLTFAVHTVS